MNMIDLLSNLYTFLLKCLHDDRGSLSLTGPADGGDVGGDVPPDDGGASAQVVPEAELSSGNLSITGQEPKVPDFLSNLDEEIASDPSLKVFKGEDGNFNVQNLIKSYVHAQKKIGEKGIQVPDKYATEEDWLNFYNQIRPEELDKYEVNPELGENQVLDEQMFTEFKKTAHAEGLTTKQAQSLLNWYNTNIGAATEAQRKAEAQQYEEQVNSLKQEWGEGESFKKELSLAQQALKEFADENTIKEMKAAGLNSNVTVIKIFNKIGKALMKEDVFNQEAHGHFGYTKEQAEKRIAQVMGADMTHPYWDPQHPEHKYVVEEVNKLHAVE